MKKKKIKNKNLDKSDQINGHPTNTVTPTEKKINIEQQRLVHLNTQWENEKAMLAKLKKEMEEAYFLLIKYQALYDKMQKNLGYIFTSYEQEGDLYTFADGAIFNYATQDFIFPNIDREEVFQVYHISFGEKVLSTRIEESFVHMHLAYFDFKDRYTLQRDVTRGATNPFTESDSIQMMEIFRAVLDRELNIELIAEAGGILDSTNGKFKRNSSVSPIAYSADGSSGSSLIRYRAEKDSKIHLRVTVWDDRMIPVDFESYRSKFTKFKTSYADMNEIDFYTGILAKNYAEKWLIHCKALIPVWFKKAEDQASLIKAFSKVKIPKVWFNGGQIKSAVPEMLE